MKRTFLYDKHIEQGAKIVDFAGWDMPLHYGSQISEHKSVRNDAGIFDVSHMRYLSIQGEDATSFLRLIICGDVATLCAGKGLYSCMLNELGGIIDDLIVYMVGDNDYRLVINAGTAANDIAWMKQNIASKSVSITEHQDMCILALQGPNARDKFSAIFPQYAAAAELKRFHFAVVDDVFIARTGYTGEDGYEIVVSQDKAAQHWDALLQGGFAPAGLGCRDTLRLEAGLSLYGMDLDEKHSPLSSALSWTIHWDNNVDDAREFIGKQALIQEKTDGIKEKIIGLYMIKPGVIRSGNTVITDVGEGTITSGSFSPTLGYSIALARVPAASSSADYNVEIRGERIEVGVVRPPFVKNGKPNEKINR